MNRREQLTTAFNKLLRADELAGKAARKAGKSLKDNPYSPTSAAADSWNKGFNKI